MFSYHKPDGYKLLESNQTYPAVVGVELFFVNECAGGQPARDETDYFIETYMPKVIETDCITNTRTAEGHTNTTVLGYLPIASREDMDNLVQTIGQNDYRCRVEPTPINRRDRLSGQAPALMLVIDTWQRIRLKDAYTPRNPETNAAMPITVHHRLPHIRPSERYEIPTYAPEPVRLRYHISRAEMEALAQAGGKPRRQLSIPDGSAPKTNHLPATGCTRKAADAKTAIKLRRFKTSCLHS